MTAVPDAEGEALLLRAHAAVARVPDPEIPVLNIVDLGIVRSVEWLPSGRLRVGVSPTYTGCPATAVIRADVATALAADGFDDVEVVDVLSPAWSSDWITAAGREKLSAFGIAPPPDPVHSVRGLYAPKASVACPRCASKDTELLSEFGSTPCKSLHRCRACLEPFDGFKCI